MGLRVLVFCALFLPACSAKVSVPLAAGADVATTAVGLRRGFVEGNPAINGQQPGVWVTAKAAATVLVVWLCDRLDERGHHGWSRGLQWFATGLWGGAAALNIYQMRTQ